MVGLFTLSVFADLSEFFIHSFDRSLVCSFVCLFVHSFVCPIVRSFAHLFIYLFIYDPYGLKYTEIYIEIL